jgi:hypothetical protein
MPSCRRTPRTRRSWSTRVSPPGSRHRPTWPGAASKVIAAGDTVPITKYATQLVANLAKLPGYPADFAAKYAANIVRHGLET